MNARMSPVVEPEHLAVRHDMESPTDAQLAWSGLGRSFEALIAPGADVGRQCIENRIKAGAASGKTGAEVRAGDVRQGRHLCDTAAF